MPPKPKTADKSQPESKTNVNLINPQPVEILPEEEEEEYSEAWADREDQASYLTTLPSDDSFLTGYASPFNESVKRQPVFESSAYFHGLAMHSHMALRYSRLNPDTGLIQRNRIGLGFGSGSGSPSGYGEIKHEPNTITDASSETPITVQGFENVVKALENTQSNIEAAKAMNPLRLFFTKARVNPDGFGGKYNVLTNNCNDFVVFMARKAGAELPARLHDSLFGPMVAYKNLRLAAEKGEASGGTRIFMANALRGRITDTTSKKSQLLFDFKSKAQFGAEKDGIDLSKYPEFNSLLDVVHRDATRLFNYSYAQEGGEGIPDALEIPGDMDAEVARISANIRRAVEYKTGKHHPKITRYLLQVEAIAREFITNSTAPPKGIDDYTDYELGYATSTLSPAERRARGNGGAPVTDQALFAGDNSSQENVKPMGVLMLTALGLGNLVRLERSARDNNIKRSNRELALLSNATSGAGGEVLTPYIKRFVDSRSFLTDDQISKLLVCGLLFGIGDNFLAVRHQILWKLDINADDYDRRMQKLVNDYLNAKENGVTDTITRQGNLDMVAAILGNMKNIVTAIRRNQSEGSQNDQP